METSTPLIIVTGAAGWLGKSVLQALAAKYPESPVRALLLPDQPTAEIEKIHPNLQIIRGDLRSRDDCAALCLGAGSASVLHTAGIIHPAKVADFYSINVAGTENLLFAAESAGARRIVAISSNSPCGCNPHPDHVFDEESPYRPYMNYGRSKMLMELAIARAGSRGNLETVIIRSPWFYGPNQPPRQTLFFSMIRDGKAPIVGDGRNRRSMAYVGNIAQGLLLALAVEKARGETYWIADRRPYTMNEIIDTVERLLENEFGQKCAHRRLRLPGLVSEAAFCADALLQSAGLYHQKIHVLSEMNKTIACTIEKAERDLGYNPPIALEEGMRRSLREWLKLS